MARFPKRPNNDENNPTYSDLALIASRFRKRKRAREQAEREKERVAIEAAWAKAKEPRQRAIAEAKKLYMENWGVMDIANATGLSYRAVIHHCTRPLAHVRRERRKQSALSGAEV